MVRTRSRDGSIVRRGQPRRGASTSRHGQLPIDLRLIPYFGLSTWSNGGSPHGTSHSLSPSSSIPSLSPHSSTPSLSPHSSTPFSTILSSSPHTYIPSSLHPPGTSPPYFTPQPLSYADTTHHIIQLAPPCLFWLVIKVGLHHSTPTQIPLCNPLLFLLYILLSLLLYSTPLLRLDTPPHHSPIRAAHPSSLRLVHSSLHTGHP